MPEMNRRGFLVAAGVAAAAVISLPVLQAHADPTGPGGNGSAKPDKPIDVGELKSFDADKVTDTWAKKPGHFYVIRNDGKLYASSALCTHKGRPLQVKTDELYCPAHKSHFTFQGTVTGGPAKSSLPRYGISVDANGHVMVDCTQEFSEAKWDDAASFVKIP
jgi:nitrite reductase/ring-hydroxylating ferredoxin subunit